MKASRTKKGNVKIVMSTVEALGVMNLLELEFAEQTSSAGNLYRTLNELASGGLVPKVFNPVEEQVLTTVDSLGVECKWIPKPVVWWDWPHPMKDSRLGV